MPHTLRTLHDEGDFIYTVWCTSCRHHVQLDIPATAAAAGWDTPFKAFRARLRCQACGAREPEIVSSWAGRPSYGQVGELR